MHDWVYKIMNKNIALNISALRKAYAENVRPMEIIEQIYSRIDEVGDPNIFICLFSKEEVIALLRPLVSIILICPYGVFHMSLKITSILQESLQLQDVPNTPTQRMTQLLW